MLVIEKLTNLVSCQLGLFSDQQSDKPFQLCFIHLLNFVANGHFSLHILCGVDPVKPILPPALPIVVLLEDATEFLQRSLGIFVFSIEYEVVVLCEYRNKTFLGVS